MIRFACPNCLNTLDVADRRAGEKLACDLCGRRVQVPTPMPTAAPPALSAPPPAPLPSPAAILPDAPLPSPAAMTPFYYLLGVLGICTPFALAGCVMIAVAFAHRPPPASTPPPTAPTLDTPAPNANDELARQAR